MPAHGGIGRQDLGELRLLGATETDLRCEQFGLDSIGDDDLVLADGMSVPLGHDTELQQHLLHVDGELLTARVVGDLDRVARQGGAGSIAFE